MNTFQIIYLFAWSSILLATRLVNADDSSASLDINNESAIEISPTDMRKLYVRRQPMTQEPIVKSKDQENLASFLRRMFITNRYSINRQRRLGSPNHSFIRFGRSARPESKEVHKDVWQNVVDMRRMTKGANRDTSFIRFGRSFSNQKYG